MATYSDDLDEVNDYLDGHVDLVDDADEYDLDALAAHVAHDRDLLRSFAAEARTVSRERDPNLAAL